VARTALAKVSCLITQRSGTLKPDRTALASWLSNFSFFITLTVLLLSTPPESLEIDLRAWNTKENKTIGRAMQLKANAIA